MSLFALFLLGLAIFLFALRWFLRAHPARVARVMRRAGSLALLALGVFLTLRGQGVLGIPLGLLGISMLRGGAWWSPGGSGGWTTAGGGGPRKSEVRTSMLRMELEHGSGRMDGEVLAGTFAGRWLSDLRDAELEVLYRECARAGDQSLKLLDAWLQRERARWWEEHAGGGAADDAGGEGTGGGGAEEDGRMTPERAREILGVPPGAEEEEIRAAHRRLVKAVHPDRGGSAWLTRQLNAARDVLLEELRARR